MEKITIHGEQFDILEYDTAGRPSAISLYDRESGKSVILRFAAEDTQSTAVVQSLVRQLAAFLLPEE